MDANITPYHVAVEHDVLVITDHAGGKVHIEMTGGDAALAQMIADLFTAHDGGSGLVKLARVAITAAVNGDAPSIAAVLKMSRNTHADCCPVCGVYAPDEAEEWQNNDGKLMCFDCAAKDVAMHTGDLSARELRRPGVAEYAMAEGL